MGAAGLNRMMLLGDALSKILHRGARIFVEGALRTSTHEGRDGKRWSKTEVMASEILFAGERSQVEANMAERGACGRGSLSSE